MYPESAGLNLYWLCSIGVYNWRNVTSLKSLIPWAVEVCCALFAGLQMSATVRVSCWRYSSCIVPMDNRYKRERHRERERERVRRESREQWRKNNLKTIKTNKRPHSLPPQSLKWSHPDRIYGPLFIRILGQLGQYVMYYDAPVGRGQGYN